PIYPRLALPSPHRHSPHSPTLFPYTTLFRSMLVTLLLAIVVILVILKVGFPAALNFVDPGGEGQPLWDRFPRAAWHVGIVGVPADRKSTRLNSSHVSISYAVFCLKNKISKQY